MDNEKQLHAETTKWMQMFTSWADWLSRFSISSISADGFEITLWLFNSSPL
jgi:hypothetical protein